MELHVKDKIHGFTVGRIRELKDINAKMVEMFHKETGAELIYLDRKDENKTFAIAFKTTPENDTGVFHILEHCVLNGSRRYPVKEPFVELLKSSMQTFLNAMTYPDKTLFPVSSRNDKDFMNLMSVYLDAVFYPAIYYNPNIFYQEGWHYEVDPETKQMSYQGVVYSEMKGSFSSVDEVIVREMNRVLYPDNCYKYVSGGDPVSIPNLSYEEFIATHQKYYHPSNARIFLDGEMDLDAVLAKINDEYLSNFEKENRDFTIPMQEEIYGQEKSFTFAIEPNEDETKKSHIAFAKILCKFSDLEKMIAWRALSEVLAGSNESILKKALLEKGLAQDIEIGVMTSMQQPFLYMDVINTEIECKEEVQETIRNTIQEVLKTGLDQNRIYAVLNRMEFNYLEPSEPAGVMFADSALRSWLYGGDPSMYLDRKYLYDSLRKKVTKGFFEDLLRDAFDETKPFNLFLASPSKTMAQEDIAQEKQRLETFQTSLGDKIEEYIRIQEKFKQWQEKEDSKEALDLLPKLQRSDVNPVPKKYEPEYMEIDDVPVLVHEVENQEIVYLDLYVSLAGIKTDMLPALGTYLNMLTDLPTRSKSVEELQTEIQMYLGSLSFTPMCFPIYHETNKTFPCMVVHCSVLKENKEKAKELILEVLKETVFTKESIRPLLAQYMDAMRQGFIGSGHVLALSVSGAMWNSVTVFNENINGIPYYNWLSDFVDHFDTKVDKFIEDATVFQNVLNNANRLSASVSGKENLDLVEEIIASLPKMDFERCVVRYLFRKKEDIGVVIPGGVSYVGRSFAVEEIDPELLRVAPVLNQILTYHYLWNEVRVKSGAYGTGMNMGNNGIVNGYSYRDPNPQNTAVVLKDSGSSIIPFLEASDDLTSFIIGTIANGEPLQSPGARIRSMNALYFGGVDYEERCKNRAALLECTSEQLIQIAQKMKEYSEKGTLCVVGSEEEIKKCGIKEENILRIFEKK